jgi:hypothetical protein
VPDYKAYKARQRERKHAWERVAGLVLVQNAPFEEGRPRPPSQQVAHANASATAGRGHPSLSLPATTKGTPRLITRPPAPRPPRIRLQR